jgi:hypothetical protein
LSRTALIAGLLGAFVGGWTAVPGAQTAPRRLELKFNNGKVTLIAQSVSVREVMAEWARQCGCIVQGTDRLTGNITMPVQFDDQPEAVVLESLLRSAGGYLLGPRATGSTGASMYGSVAVFPVVRGIAVSSPYSPAAPIAAPLVTGGSPDDEIPPVTPVANPQTPPATPGRPGGPAPGAPGGPAPGAPGGPAAPPPGSPGRAAGAGSIAL